MFLIDNKFKDIDRLINNIFFYIIKFHKNIIFIWYFLNLLEKYLFNYYLNIYFFFV